MMPLSLWDGKPDCSAWVQWDVRRRGLLLLAAAACLFAKTKVDYDRSARFSNYHTYSWVAVKVQDSMWNDPVTHAIDRQLVIHGWRKVVSAGDASIVALGSTETEQTLETWYSAGFGGGWFHRGWAWRPGIAAAVERTAVGTLHIDIFDAVSKKVIWHAVCAETLTGNPKKNQKKLDQAIAAAFKKFAPPEKRQ
jgi:hypothetical protein